MHARIEHVGEELKRPQADAGVAPRERVDSDEHDGADDVPIERRPKGDSVRDEYVLLE